VPGTAGANADTEAQFNVNAPSANFSALFGRAITFGDSDVVTASDAQITNGAYMGELSSVAILGLANEGCNQQVPVTFNFVDANTVASALAMSPGVTLTGAITNAATSFTYTSTGDPIGPSDSNAAHTRAEIQIDSEQMLVTTINEGTNTYSNITRAWNGTAAAAHNAGAAILKVNTIFPAGPTSNLLANMAEDDGDLDNNGTAEFTAMAGNQVSDGAEAIPSFIRDSFDPDGDPDNGGYVTPRARYYGVAFVASALIVTLQFVIMDPGALTTFQSLDWATANWGYSSTTFLQDPLAPPSNSAISDFCNFSSNTRLFGITHDNACTGASPPVACTGTGAGFTLRLAADGGCPGVTAPNECGGVRSTNPPTAQRVRYYQYSVSQRDYDDDSHENALDVCHSDANAAWDPRAFNGSSGSDGDADGLPAACDPNNAAFNNDQDADGWQNRIDICPTIANSEGVAQGGGTIANTFQFDQDFDPGTNNIAADVPDGGPASDSIGPACDIAGESCITDAQGDPCSTLTPTGANGHYHAAAATQTICVGAATADCSDTADNDVDGVANSRDNCLDGANAPITFAGPNGQDTLAVAAGAGATSVTLTSAAGFTNGSSIVINSPLETVRYITSIAGNTLNLDAGLAAAHGIGDPVAQIAFAQSARDVNGDGFVDISDVSLLTGVFGSQGGDPGNDGVGDGGTPGYQGRYDNNFDSFIDISDVSALTGVFGVTCGPAA